MSSSVRLGYSAGLVLVTSICKPLKKGSISSSSQKIVVIGLGRRDQFIGTSALLLELCQPVKRVQVELLGNGVPQTWCIDCQAKKLKGSGLKMWTEHEDVNVRPALHHCISPRSSHPIGSMLPSRHFETRSLLLFNVIFRFAVMIFSFSARHNWHFLIFTANRKITLNRRR